MRSKEDHPTYPVARLWVAAMLFAASLTLAGCGGADPDPEHTPEGYTLTVSGGTLNDGTGTNGLVALVTLRDSAGRGPGGAAGWNITITGPGIDFLSPALYDDGSTGSYITWRWNVVPNPGTYTAVATDGITNLTASFTIDDSHTMDQPVLNLIGNTVSWPEVGDAGSYHYRIINADSSIIENGYLAASECLLGECSFPLPTLPNGDYTVDVFAHTTDRLNLMIDTSSAPDLAVQENNSLATLSPLTISGSTSNYSLNARGGVMSYSDGMGGYRYGLVIWTSILSGEGVTPTDQDWVITVDGPGLKSSLTYLYPKKSIIDPAQSGLVSHYLNWDFFITPVAGTYTVTATSPPPQEILTDTFTIPNVAARLPIATNLQVTPTAGGGAEASWDPVPGAASYYVNLWHDNPDPAIGYEQIAGGWVTTPTAIIGAGTMTPGEVYDMYVTASTMDMTDMLTIPPPAPGRQVDMSDNVFDEARFVAQ